MKDLSLSLLSRGCGRFVSTGRYDGRLDVFLTPQDYYIWKSQVSFLQVSNRGHLHVEAVSTLPKTYSTRRGPLLLYSQDLVALETSCQLGTRDRKRRVVRRYTRRVEQDLSTVKELTAAILSYSNNQFTSSRLGPPFFPPLHLPPVPDLHRPSPPPIHITQEQSSQELLLQLNPEWLPAEPNTEQDKNQPEDEEEEQRKQKRVRQDVFLQVPCTSRAPSPQIQHQPCAHSDSMISDEELQTYYDVSQQHTEGSHQTDVNQQSLGGELHHPNMICVPDMADDQSCSSQDSETTSDNDNYEKSLNAKRHGLLPPLTQRHSVCHGPCWERTGRPQLKGPSSDEHHEQPLPPIAESCAVDPSWAVQAQVQTDARPSAETFGCKSQENPNRLHHQLLFPPLLFPGKEEEINGKQRGRGEKTERQNFKTEPEVQGGAGGGRLPSEKGSVILLEPREEPPPPVGVSGCVAGWRGLGKQSSLAFLQNPLHDLQDPCEANRGVVRGILPLELRDLQNGKSVGCLILGPDGEIIQLSLYNSSHNPPQGACNTQEQALQVLSADGETLPWVIVLQSEHTHAECAERGVELNTNVPEGDIQQHQYKLIDLHSDTNAYTPSGHTDPVAVTQEKIKSAEAVTETRKAPKKDAKNHVRLPPLREPRGGHTEAEEDDKQEEWGGTQQSSHLSGSRQPSLSREKLQVKDDTSCSEQNINSQEATTEDTVDQKRRNTKRRDTQRDVKPVRSTDTEGQKTSRTRKEGRRQRHKRESDAAQSTRSQKQEEKTNREAAETKKQSVLPPEKKKTTHRQEEMEAKVNGEKGEQGEVTRQKEDSDGRRRRRGRLKHKEFVTDNDGKEELEMNKEMEEGSRLKYTKRSSATQRNNNETETKSKSPNPEEDTDRDRLSSSVDRHSSVQSVSSLRSTAAASQFTHRSRRRSASSSCEGAVPTSATGLALSRGRLSSCSTVMVTEEQLMLNTVKPESSRPRKSEEEEAAVLRLAQRAERRRLEVERKRREQEEEERKQQEREQTEERMKSELAEERRKKAEELRSYFFIKVEVSELELLRLEEQRRQEEESKKLQEMDEIERTEYLRRKEQEEEDRRNKEEERRRTEEEAAFQAAEEDRLHAELLARQMALLQQQLAFKRGLTLEAEGLEKSQGISRPWIYSYFSLLELLGLSSATAGTTTP
ncbi:uncharacterized protein KIAA2012 homolog [Acanthopagrus latus]|uniref:uncharacterized protein KIAA2012 homolog n=1 Tax=Acanthopagrus latus TaxID=8177 RepID=UPI00187BDA7A|nr:uncharacterized protein KIAA2012 homolog [Acanthopagrus latus]